MGYLNNKCFVKCLLFTLLLFGVQTYELTILHINDLHARFDQTSKSTKECTAELANMSACVGGEARRTSVIKDIRSTYQNTLLLDAGDRFVGTIWFNTYKGGASAFFLNEAQFDAACIGNHEFDLGLDIVVSFLSNLTVPMLCANLDISKEPRLQGLIEKSKVIERDGRQIGIVGVITSETTILSNAGPTVEFTDEIAGVRSEVNSLRSAGIQIIIVLSHCGYEMDLKIAAEVDGIDIIVGGHSHTFLYTGEQPSTEDIEGPYPTVVTQTTSRQVLVVHAFAYGKYMGLINVEFDDDMEVLNWTGNPILLDNTITQDPSTRATVDNMRTPVEAWITDIVGSSAVRLDGECRFKECNAGNLISDAIVWYHIKHKKLYGAWGLAAMAAKNGGSITATLEAGPITRSQVMSILPYADSTNLIRTNGSYIWQAFEHSVTNYETETTEGPGPFLQVSGIRVVYDLRKPAGSRVVSLRTRCNKCHVPFYSPIEMDQEYSILLDDWLIRGGGGYSMFKEENIIERIKLNSPVAESVAEYLKAHQDIFPEIEDRIVLVESDGISTSTTTPALSIIVHTCPPTGVNAATVPHLNFAMFSSFLMVLTRAS